jgi:hypothetical protein
LGADVGVVATPYFVAFDALSINREDLRARPLIERKRRLQAIMPRMMSRLPYPKDCCLLVYGPDVAPGYDVWNWPAELRRAA